MSTLKHTTLTHLIEHSAYYFKIYNNMGSQPGTGSCAATLEEFTTICREDASPCINYTDLHSCRVTAHYGTFTNPDLNWGVIDNGSSQASSRHTVHTNTIERDARTNYQLLTVAPGEAASVRLGNWMSGGQAESITYEYIVDTLVNDLLILRYAAVLENPDHSAAEQPRFTFRILDTTGAEVNSGCYSADFVADASLGWNTYGDVLWKNWTTVGVDLTPLHGQRIYVKLTTYDCAQTGHYGYAYFVLNCGNKTIESTACGDTVENVFTAPDGFSYRWYREGNEMLSLGTSRTLYVTRPGTYKCRLRPIGSVDGSCGFEMTAVAGYRYPYAVWNFTELDSGDCYLRVRLLNNSIVTTDPLHLQPTAQGCEGVEWTIDDTIRTTEANPILTLPPGDHSVQLVAYIGGGSCRDTAQGTLFIDALCSIHDSAYANICLGQAYHFFDTIILHPGMYTKDSANIRRTLFLTQDTLFAARADTIVQNQLPWTVSGFRFEGDVADSLLVISGQGRCDTLLTYSLKVWPNTATTMRNALCENYLPYAWNGLQLTADTTVSVTLLGHHGVDSTITLTFAVLHNTMGSVTDSIVERLLPYRFMGRQYYDNVAADTLLTTNAAGCDSLVVLHLAVYRNVHGTADSTVCEGQLPLVWNYVAFTAADTATAIFAGRGPHGVDSLLFMTLNVLYNTAAVRSDTVIENLLPYTYCSQDFYTDTAHYPITLTNAVGCDSLVDFSLTVLRNHTYRFDTALCISGLPIVWRHLPFDSAGTQQRTYLAANGTDSTEVCSLTAWPVYDSLYWGDICSGGEYWLAGRRFSVGGDYLIELQSRHGCDSLLHLHIEERPSYSILFREDICDNDSVFFCGHYYSIQGAYDTLMQTVTGCDSLVQLVLTTRETFASVDHQLFCESSSFRWIDGNIYYQTTSEPTFVMTAQNGCDSVISLDLQIDHSMTPCIRAKPLMVNYDQHQVWLDDCSLDNAGRVWKAPGMADTNRTTTYDYPVTHDSVRIVLHALSQHGCSDTASVVIRIDRTNLWAPNAFTPKNDRNNRFYVLGEDIDQVEVSIFTRQGALVCRYSGLDGSWDGTHNGQLCPAAAYTYLVRYTSQRDPRNWRSKRGTVLLIR